MKKLLLTSLLILFFFNLGFFLAIFILGPDRTYVFLPIPTHLEGKIPQSQLTDQEFDKGAITPSSLIKLLGILGPSYNPGNFQLAIDYLKKKNKISQKQYLKMKPLLDKAFAYERELESNRERFIELREKLINLNELFITIICENIDTSQLPQNWCKGEVKKK